MAKYVEIKSPQNDSCNRVKDIIGNIFYCYNCEVYGRSVNDE